MDDDPIAALFHVDPWEGAAQFAISGDRQSFHSDRQVFSDLIAIARPRLIIEVAPGRDIRRSRWPASAGSSR
jgi:hypothetical protein